MEDHLRYFVRCCCLMFAHAFVSVFSDVTSRAVVSTDSSGTRRREGDCSGHGQVFLLERRVPSGVGKCEERSEERQDGRCRRPVGCVHDPQVVPEWRNFHHDGRQVR